MAQPLLEPTCVLGLCAYDRELLVLKCNLCDIESPAKEPYGTNDSTTPHSGTRLLVQGLESRGRLHFSDMCSVVRTLLGIRENSEISGDV